MTDWEKLEMCCPEVAALVVFSVQPAALTLYTDTGIGHELTLTERRTRPLVVSAVETGLPEVVRSQWGRLCPPGDVEALADALDAVLGVPVTERAAMGAAGRAFVLQECSLAIETAKLVELIRG